MHLNPDHFLATPTGRWVTAERNAWAWQQCLALLPPALSAAAAGHSATLYVLVGAQGAGKSTWARACAAQEPNAVIFDAILMRRAERAPLLAAARTHGAKAVAVVFHTPLADCLRRNAARPADEVVPEQAVRNVFAALEMPTLDEGFAEIRHVGDQGGA